MEVCHCGGLCIPSKIVSFPPDVLLAVLPPLRKIMFPHVGRYVTYLSIAKVSSLTVGNCLPCKILLR